MVNGLPQLNHKTKVYLLKLNEKYPSLQKTQYFECNSSFRIIANKKYLSKSQEGLHICIKYIK